METLPSTTTSVTLHGDTDERPDLGESLESASAKKEDTESPTNAEDKYPNVSPNESKQAGSGDCTELAAPVPVEDSQSAESSVEGADHSVDDGSKAASHPEVPNIDTNLEEKPVPSDPGHEQAETEKLATTEDTAEAKTAEKSQKEKLSTVSDKCDTSQDDKVGECQEQVNTEKLATTEDPTEAKVAENSNAENSATVSDTCGASQDDVAGACAPRTSTKSKREDSRTVVDFDHEDEMELWLWMNDIIDECGEEFLKEQDYRIRRPTITEMVCESLTSADETEAGATFQGPEKEGRKTGEDDKLHEKLNIRRQQFNREILRRVTVRAYGRHLPKGVNPSDLGHYFFETLPDLFSRIAWFDACYTQLEMNTPGDFNTLSLFIVPGVEFWAHIPLPFPLETKLSLGQQKCRLEELYLWTEFSRKSFAKTFFAVADKYKIPKFWKAQVANFDKLVLALRERTAEMKKVKKRDLKKLAPQKTFLQVFEEGYENFDKACRNLLCPKCNRQFSEAVAFEVCGHELCTGCVADCLRAGALCPVCNTALKGTRFLPVWRFRWYEKGLKPGEKENQKKPKDLKERHEVVTEIVDGTRQDSEGRHGDVTEIVDDTRKDSESQHEDDTEIVEAPTEVSESQSEENQTLFEEQEMGEVSEGFQSLSVDDDGLETLPTAKCG
ncbi:hypothetical protein Bbelb_008590 [Branchiostoma belcheri]|nr:hypothetical protein Bbelb_008590 [Branchiostoma belcheri]